jgi:3-phenylpropionate/cinnamic acid dioxygenase small subunit
MSLARADGADEFAALSSSEKVALQFEIEQFLYHEASLLDERRYDDWLELIADDIHYWMPIRRTVTLDNIGMEFTRIGDMAFFDDDKHDLTLRVEKFKSGSSWSEDPPSRTRHFVANVQITGLKGEEIGVRAAFYLYRTRLDKIVDSFVGRREDKLRRVDDSFQIFQRHIYLDQTVIPSTNMSSLF